MWFSEKQVGAALEKLRLSKGLSIADLARRAAQVSGRPDFGNAIISNAEQGHNYPVLPSLIPWLKALDTTPGEFFAGMEADRSSDKIHLAPGFDEFYRLLTEIIESGNKMWIDGIHANLKAMAQVAGMDESTHAEKGHLHPNIKKKTGKKPRAS